MFQAFLQLQSTTSHTKRNAQVLVPAASRQYSRDQQPQLSLASHLHTRVRICDRLRTSRTLLALLLVMFRQALLSVSLLVLRLLSDTRLAHQSVRPNDVPLRLLDGQTTLDRSERGQHALARSCRDHASQSGPSRTRTSRPLVLAGDRRRWFGVFWRFPRLYNLLSSALLSTRGQRVQDHAIAYLLIDIYIIHTHTLN